MEKSDFEKENERKNMALFRYGIISPLINDMHPFASKEEFFRDVSSKKYTLPNGKEAIFDKSTIKKWYMNYNQCGFDSLMPKSRADSRSI